MADREAVGQPPGLAVERPQEQDDNVVSSSTPMETDVSGGDENQGAQSLPQTYQASPPMAGAAHNATATVSDTDVSSAHTMAAQQSYVSTTSIHPADYTASVMPHGSYIPVTSPDTVSASQGGDVSSVTLPQTYHVTTDTLPQTGGLGSVTLPQTSHAGSVTLPQTSDVASINLPQNSNVGTVHFPQTSDVGSVNLPHTSHVSSVSLPQTGEVVSVHLPQTGDMSALSMGHGADRMHAGETSQGLPVTLPQTGMVPSLQARDVTSVTLSQTGAVSGMEEVHQMRGSQMEDMNRAGMPELDDNRMTLPQTAEVVLPQTHSLERDARALSLSQVPTEVEPAAIQQAGEAVAHSHSHASYAAAAQRADYLPAHLAQTQSPAAGGSPHTPASVEVPAVNLPQSEEYRAAGVTHPHYAEVGKMEAVYTSADISRMSAQPHIDVRVVSLPQAGGVSKMEVIYTSADASDMGAQQHADVRVVSLPQTSGVTKMEVAYTAADGGEMGAQQHGNVRVLTLPHTSGVSKMEVVYPEGDEGEMGGAQHGDVGVVTLPQTSGVSKMEVVYAAVDGTTLGAQHGDIRVVTLPQTVDVRAGLEGYPGDVGRLAYTTADMTGLSAGQQYRQQEQEARGGEAQAHDYSRVNVTYAAGDLRTSAVYAAADVHNVATSQSQAEGRREGLYSDVKEMSAAYSTEDYRMTVSYPLDTHATGYTATDLNRMSVAEASTVSAVPTPSTAEAGRASLPPHDSPLSLPHTADVRPHSVPHLSSSSTAAVSLAQYQQQGSVRPAQASSVAMETATSHGTISLPQTADVSAVPATVRSEAYDVRGINLSQQTHADDINMHMMAEAAEIISRNTAQVDDVNMRLMAEAADYISRNVPQTSGAATSQAAVNGRMGGQTATPTISDSSGQVPTTFSVAATSQAASGYSSAAQSKHTTTTRRTGPQPVTRKTRRGSSSQSAITDKLKMEQEVVASEEYDIIPGFRAEFFQSQSYDGWRRIGIAHRLHSDEEIACFLMR